ncbi:uncharacterized protein LOC121182145 [Toxotes jaculatrix]|uniref:uncharacterized protein LOC121182145 n=1 Tax=Toxotes jaculatrix TaxID=941984 RepID=UPI001B3AA47C|nr:uncharacterized protein LOC121182145 [Toxotes jaculatrix]
MRRYLVGGVFVRNQAAQRDLEQDMKETTPVLGMETHSLELTEVFHDHSYSRVLTLKKQLQASQLELNHPEETSAGLKCERFFLQRLQSEPELIMFYTGFKDYNTLKAFYLVLQPTPETIGNWSQVLKKTEDSTVDAGFQAQHLCLFDQLFLFLCFVRRGFFPIDMSKRLLVSEDIVLTTCITWCHYLFFMLGTLPIWPSRRAVDKLMPPFFTATFPKTRVVLDLIEIHIQLATCTVNSSHHKGSTTLKSLVGITPSGSVSFVSSVFTASISDKDVIRESGILNLLEPGDEVMADKSLEIKEILDGIGVNLVSLTFLGPNEQLNQDDITHTRTSGRLKIHVQKAISRIKEYHVFDDVPSTLCASVNQLWTACALLTNFQGPLI